MKSSLTISSSKICGHDEETSKALKWPSLFIYFNFCVNLCVHICMWGWGQEGGRKGGRGWSIFSIFLSYSSLWLWEEGLLPSLLLTPLSWLSSQALGSVCLHLFCSALGLQAPSTSPSFLLQVPGSNSGHHSCVSWLFKFGVSELSFKYQQARGSPTTV